MLKRISLPTVLQTIFWCSIHALAVAAQTRVLAENPSPSIAAWNSPNVQHAYGLPETKPKQKGRLTINDAGLTFMGRSNVYTIPRGAITALNNGQERVELWGMKGRLLRMAIPDGGGIAAAGFMHHKVTMLTVEFRDARGGYHAAVFYLPQADAQRVVNSLVIPLLPEPEVAAANRATVDVPAPDLCRPSDIKPRSVLIAEPAWSQAEVPAAYRALGYEHMVDRMQKLEGMGHVYREGEVDAQHGCPQYIVRTSIVSFRQGSQVKRAVMGPVGMFAGTTQMVFNVTMTDAGGHWNNTEQIKATVRGESESKNVAESVAKNIAKHYAKALKKLEQTGMASIADKPRR